MSTKTILIALECVAFVAFAAVSAMTEGVTRAIFGATAGMTLWMILSLALTKGKVTVRSSHIYEQTGRKLTTSGKGGRFIQYERNGVLLFNGLRKHCQPQLLAEIDLFQKQTTDRARETLANASDDFKRSLDELVR